jgi:hypothetical protein
MDDQTVQITIRQPAPQYGDIKDRLVSHNKLLKLRAKNKAVSPTISGYLKSL